jgi:hypothetical protein
MLIHIITYEEYSIFGSIRGTNIMSTSLKLAVSYLKDCMIRGIEDSSLPCIIVLVFVM